MENVKYIPGDLVKTNGVPIGTAKDVVYRVVASNPNKTVTLESGEVLEGTVTLDNTGDKRRGKGYLFVECCAWVKDIVPILLTPQILEANGWKTQNGTAYFLDVEEGYIPYIDIDFERKTNDSKLLVEVYNRAIVKIEFVHQLQHLLFGLGLNSEIKV